MAFTRNEWDIVKAYYEIGLSLAEIVAQDDVAITDRSTISKQAKKEGWIKGKKSTIVEKEIHSKQLVQEIKEEKSTFNSTELRIHDKVVEKRLRLLQFFEDAAAINVKNALKKECAGQLDHKHLADTILKGKETVFGKAPETAVQVNVGQETPKAVPKDPIAAAKVYQDFISQ